LHIRYPPRVGTNNRDEFIALWTLLETDRKKDIKKLQVMGESKLVIDWAHHKVIIKVMYYYYKYCYYKYYKYYNIFISYIFKNLYIIFNFYVNFIFKNYKNIFILFVLAVPCLNVKFKHVIYMIYLIFKLPSYPNPKLFKRTLPPLTC
jgi:hypothetical protein